MSDIRIGIIGHDSLSADYQRALQILIEQEAASIIPITQSPYSETQTALADAKAQHGLNAIVVAGSKSALTETICDALRLGQHVFSTHPIPRTIEDMIQIRSAEYAARGQVLQFGFTVREHESVRSALTKVAGQSYGKLLTMRAVHGLSAPEPSDNAMSDSGGGVLIGPGAHMVDLMQAFAGPFEEIKALTQNHLSPHSGVEDNVFAMLRTHTDVLASLHASATQWRETFRLELGLSKVFSGLKACSARITGLDRKSSSMAKRVIRSQPRAMKQLSALSTAMAC